MKKSSILNKLFKFNFGNDIYYCTDVQADRYNNVKSLRYIKTNNGVVPDEFSFEDTLLLPNDKLHFIEKSKDLLGAPYVPVSENVRPLNTVVPDNMAFDIHEALNNLRLAVGNTTEFVCERCKYSLDEIKECLGAEQVDAVALAIYNIEARNQGIIIGDQTGIGKGRQAATIIRYASLHGYLPIFVTVQDNLFSDMYRDLCAVHSSNLVPFFVNTSANMRDDDENVIYKSMGSEESKKFFTDWVKNGKNKKSDLVVDVKVKINKKSTIVKKKCDYICATYTQFSKAGVKREFLTSIAQNEKVIFILDESHTAGGQSNRGFFFQDLLGYAKGVVFLSATYAKRPDNMPIYAQNTALRETNVDMESLTNTIIKGGVPLQENISSNLVLTGQLVRRERPNDGVEVNYIYLNKEGEQKYGVKDREKFHQENCDKITELIRDIIKYEDKYIKPFLEGFNVKNGVKQIRGQKSDTTQQQATSSPFFSRVFNIINQMLFAIKAEDIADRALTRLREDKKVIIAFSSTMGSFLSDTFDGGENEFGDVFSTDFSAILLRGLSKVFNYTVRNGKKIEHLTISFKDLDPNAEIEYKYLQQKIKRTTSNISISPIDIIIQKLVDNGYKVGEVTGRNLCVEFTDSTYTRGRLKTIAERNAEFDQKGVDKKAKFTKFQNNELDVLLINQSGSTGASAHAIPTSRVPESEVKQRVMIVGQAELDINQEIQKRGRINRTGQIYKPIYDYVTSSIPAEKRLMMMLQKKLKSLDANTSANQKNSADTFNYDDFLNKYGEECARDFLMENKNIARMLGISLKEKENSEDDEDSAVGKIIDKATGRCAILPVEQQTKFYNEITQLYKDKIDYLIQTDSYDLETNVVDYKAELVKKNVISAGGGEGLFGGPAFLCQYKCVPLKKPYKANEVKDFIKNYLQDRNANDIANEISKNYKDYAYNQIDRIKESAQKKEREINEKISKLSFDDKDYESKKANLEEKIINLNNDAEDDVKKIESNINIISGLIRFYYCGRALKMNIDGVDFLGVCLGIQVNEKEQNPYTAGKLFVDIALMSSMQKIRLNFAKKQLPILEISQTKTQYEYYNDNAFIESWDEKTKYLQDSKVLENIITGNVFLGFDYLSGQSNTRGKFIKFTTDEGTVESGILVISSGDKTTSDNNVNSQNFIDVPCNQCYKVINGLTGNSSIYLNNGFSIYRDGYRSFKISTNRKTDIKSFLTDTTLNRQILDSEFVLRGSTYIADFTQIQNLLDYLWDNHKLKIQVSRANIGVYGIHIVENSNIKVNWSKLSYDKNKIPSGSISKILKLENNIINARVAGLW